MANGNSSKSALFTIGGREYYKDRFKKYPNENAGIVNVVDKNRRKHSAEGAPNSTAQTKKGDSWVDLSKSEPNHVVRLSAHEAGAEKHWFVTERVSGSLRDVMSMSPFKKLLTKENRLDINDAIDILLDVDAVHKRGYSGLHLSPDRIMRVKTLKPNIHLDTMGPDAKDSVTASRHWYKLSWFGSEGPDHVPAEG